MAYKIKDYDIHNWAKYLYSSDISLDELLESYDSLQDDIDRLTESQRKKFLVAIHKKVDDWKTNGIPESRKHEFRPSYEPIQLGYEEMCLFSLLLFRKILTRKVQVSEIDQSIIDYIEATGVKSFGIFDEIRGILFHEIETVAGNHYCHGDGDDEFVDFNLDMLKDESRTFDDAIAWCDEGIENVERQIGYSREVDRQIGALNPNDPNYSAKRQSIENGSFFPGCMVFVMAFLLPVFIFTII